jgi:hypothetical protein
MRYRPCLGLALLFGITLPVRAENEMRLELGELAKSIEKLLKLEEQTEIALGAFLPAKDEKSNAGPGIRQTLEGELVKLKIKVNPQAKCVIEGTYQGGVDAKSNKLMIQLEASFANRLDPKSKRSLPRRGIFGDDVPTYLGTTIAFLPDDGDEIRERRLVKIDEKPTTLIRENRVFADERSPYSIEIRVKKEGEYRAVKPVLEDGQAYVKLARDDVYAIALFNDSGVESISHVRIDGLNVFSFLELKDPQTGEPKFSRYITPAKKSVMIRGWPITMREADEFKITEYARSAVKKIDASRASIGMITVDFAACWPKDAKAPEDEPKGMRSSDATGMGSRIETSSEPVERRFGVRRAIVSVRYNR